MNSGTSLARTQFLSSSRSSSLTVKLRRTQQRRRATSNACAVCSQRMRCRSSSSTPPRLQLTPQTENVFTVFKDGWYAAEVAEHNASVEWQWTKKQATLSFKNPKKDSLFYLELKDPGTFNEPQQVQVSLGGEAVDRFALGPKQEVLRKIPLPAARLGSVDLAELEISVDKTFVPALLDPNSKDPRELGVRVFHAFVDAR